MTNLNILEWIKENLADDINTAIAQVGDNFYTEDWIASIACREVGVLINRYVTQNPYIKVVDLAPLMRGDYTKRPADTEFTYHGFSFWQIDLASFPDWIKTGAWKDAVKSCVKAINVLQSKRNYIVTHISPLVLDNNSLQRAMTAAYNCGEGRIVQVIHTKPAIDLDTFTTNKNYSAQVFEFRNAYNSLNTNS